MQQQHLSSNNNNKQPNTKKVINQQQQQSGRLTPVKRTTSNITKRRESVTSYGRGHDKYDITSALFTPTKANAKLEQHKDELKKNILRKRSILERNIRMEINDKMHNTKTLNVIGIGGNVGIKNSCLDVLNTTGVSSCGDLSSNKSSCSNISITGIDDCENTLIANVVPRTNINKNKSQIMSTTTTTAATSQQGRRTKSMPCFNVNSNKSDNKSQPLINVNPGYGGANTSKKPRKPPNSCNRGNYSANRTANTLNPRNPNGRPRKTSLRKKEKLYCICLTPYDDTKFYVGCDICSNWFHGDCVNISEEDSKKLTEFICNDCKLARDTQQLYCLCRQPYDESQFYICCDKCQDWFHGRCVGIVQTEADFIDEYVCPDCQQNNTTNKANIKNLTESEKDDLKKLVKVIKTHKSAWPFKQAVDPEEAPDYYNIIKEPMDLQLIEKKLTEHRYAKLSEFIGDMTKMFDNCRYFNDKDSTFFKCAEALESFFVQKIKEFRRNVVNHA